MSRVFITGSAGGLGQMAAKILINEGHDVVLHARNNARAADAKAAVPKAETVVTGDLSVIAETINMASQVNKLGLFDAIIHNAAVGYQEPQRINTIDNLPHVFAVNSLAPYILTSLINKPKRLVYLSSGLHRNGDTSIEDLEWIKRKWSGFNAYADSKLHDVILCFAIARRWPGISCNAVDPGWVPTRMGGPSAPGNLEEGTKTQVWLAVTNDNNALVTGKYFHHKKPRESNPAASDEFIQEKFLAECARISGIPL